MIRDWLVPVLWISAVLAPVLFIADGFIGWRPRLGVDAYFQQVIREADVAEKFGGSRDNQTDDVTDRICERINQEILAALPRSFDHYLPGQNPDTKLTRVMEDKGFISACRDGITRLDIEVGTNSRSCKAQVRLWHAGCAI